MKIPEEIKKRVSVDEIDLQILVKEIKEREREIRINNNNCSNNIVSPKFNKTYSKRLYYNIKIYYIILFLNIFFPGIGTIIVAIGWGNTCKYKDRTKELLLRGIIQILTIIFLIGWVKAIFDAINYFE